MKISFHSYANKANFHMKSQRDAQRDARSQNVVKSLDYCMKQIDSILPWVCTLIRHRGRQNVVRLSVTYFFVPTTF